ncbi:MULTISPECIES: hypothetical protein [Methylobacterium]|uniref:Uncharacterized protein n=1 Tax=Methylobacterium jeotgali TaxID=381630 RepID=A0ABQ4SSN8_9HYPH|nr:MULTISPECIES: hypothetical protein [Methylobacterium]PIU07449.1 MAG: hypothetical protein COT56_05130 [Methylobacterium sp. CG09_land_8_20_14_0_10_71_15]PIU13985.1 MAG: hypothetical protein COT28_09595 [Methylobacterium sp. CG08_land_8_20_14_0_20_71_15]GBU17315.1 hypothetical protein AwMethylo_15300 [Methylobacterium sp.]GJE05509.1 hypothetical protein AOPFMNJM_0809 [Methylobacterium jeotgali]
MRIKTIALAMAAATAALTATTPVTAAEWKPATNKRIELGNFRGMAYYTVEKDGYRVVTTLAALNTNADHPQVIRFVTTLKGDQTVNLSVPGTLGADGSETTIALSRKGDVVEVADASY